MSTTDSAHHDIRYRTIGRYSANGELIAPPGEWGMIEGIKETSAKIEGLEPATTYELQVRAVDETGPGPWADFAVITTKPETSNG